MTTIDLPSADHPLALLDVGGIGVHVVEGVPDVHVSSDGRTRATRLHPDGSVQLFPPPEWVALSEQKCETCGGSGRTEMAFRINASLVRKPCKTCLGSGRPLVQVTEPCPICLGYYVLHDCRRCDNGRVSIGSVTVEREPLRIFDRIIPPVNVKPGQWLAWAGGHYLIQECNGAILITRPGKIVGPPPDTFDLDAVFGVIVRMRTVASARHDVTHDR